MPTPENLSRLAHLADATGSKPSAYLHRTVVGKVGPRFRGDDEFGASDFPRTALRFRGDDGVFFKHKCRNSEFRLTAAARAY
jgi:hypothetical protein